MATRPAAAVAGCLLLPFALLHWIVPLWSSSTIGNDYVVHSIRQQMELMLSLETGSWPLFVPLPKGGMSASGFSLGQAFHPLTHVAVRLPGYWEGRALDWGTLLRLLSLGLAHAGLYAFLVRLGLGWRWSFGLGALTVYNLRMLDLFRYGASLESWTGYLLLCAALGVHAMEPTPVRGPLTIVVSTAWLVCSGHPQMAFYGLIGAGALTLLLPWFCAAVSPGHPFRPRDALRFWLQAGACGIAAILLSAAYVVPFVFEFMPENQPKYLYAWTDSFRDRAAGDLNNFFQPLRSDVHGAFGGSRLILVGALLPLLLVVGARIPAPVWVAWAGGLVVFLLTLGGLTPLHRWMVEGVPFASQMRVPGRLSMLLPVCVLLILAWLVRPGPEAREGAPRREAPRALLAGVAGVLIGVHFLLTEPRADLAAWAPLQFRHIPGWAEPASTLLGMTALAGLAVHGVRHGGRSLEAVVVSATLLETAIALRNGTWEAPRIPTPYLASMVEHKKVALAFDAIPVFERAPSSVLAEHERRGARHEPVLARVTGDYTLVRDREEAYALVASRPSSQPLVVEMDSANEPAAARADAAAPGSRVSLRHAAFNRLVFDVWSARPGFFCLAYPYNGHWRADVDGLPSPVYRANGAAHAVRVPAGSSTVEFRYRSPAASWGMAVSCLTGSALAVFFGFRSPRRRLRFAGVAAAVLIAAGGWAWRQSLYTGQGFGTHYVWSEG